MMNFNLNFFNKNYKYISESESSENLLSSLQNNQAIEISPINKNKLVKKIILTRPAVEAGESLGFLPGDLKEKIDPYLRPLYDALDDMIPADKLAYYMSSRTIEIAPLAYMRGRTLDNAFIILDESQNANDLQIKMFLTRIGENSKLVVNGDPSQVDLVNKSYSGLVKSKKILILGASSDIGLKTIDLYLNKGWKVQKKENRYIFTKKHNGKKEVLTDKYLKRFIETNISS